jgi:hypothetical protein
MSPLSRNILSGCGIVILKLSCYFQKGNRFPIGLYNKKGRHFNLRLIAD